MIWLIVMGLGLSWAREEALWLIENKQAATLTILLIGAAFVIVGFIAHTVAIIEEVIEMYKEYTDDNNDHLYPS